MHVYDPFPMTDKKGGFRISEYLKIEYQITIHKSYTYTLHNLY